MNRRTIIKLSLYLGSFLLLFVVYFSVGLKEANSGCCTLDNRIPEGLCFKTEYQWLVRQYCCAGNWKKCDYVRQLWYADYVYFSGSCDVLSDYCFPDSPAIYQNTWGNCVTRQAIKYIRVTGSCETGAICPKATEWRNNVYDLCTAYMCGQQLCPCN